MWNALVGVLIVNVINNGMVVIGLPDYVQDGMLGLLVIIVLISVLPMVFEYLRERRKLKAEATSSSE